MNNQFNFNHFSRQSKKGIFVIYINLLYKALRMFWILLFLFIKDFSKFSTLSLNYIYLGISFFLLFFLIRAFFIYRSFRFKVVGGEFILHRGILKKTKTSISFDRIQNINFRQNLIQQIINVYQVDIETAGSNKTEISIKALPLKQAKALKEQISLKKKVMVDDEVINKPFLKINIINLLKVSITENHLQSLFIFISLLLALYIQIEDVFKSFGNGVSIGGAIDISGLQGSIVLFLVLFFILIILGVFVSFTRVFLMYFDLIVFVKDKTFEITQGLLTKTSVILKTNKIQNIIISTNPIKRKLDISFITFKQAVSGKLNKKKSKIIKIVGCNKEHILEVKETLFNIGNIDFLEKKYPDIYFRNRMFFLSFVFVLCFNFGLFLLYHSYKITLINIVVIPSLILWIQVKYKKAFYKINNDLLLVGNGVFNTNLTYFQLYKIQNVKLKQSYFQSRRNIVSLVLQTASGKIKIPCIEKEKAYKIYNYILFKAESSTESWM